jgi:drug/metabolite transporter (DMT)-like permease
MVFRKDFRLKETFRNIGSNDILLGLFQGTGFVAFVFALLHTTVANALFIFSAAPLVAAVLGWWVLKELVPGRTWVAISIAMVGLMVMVGGGIAGGRYLGNLIALWVPISYAVTVILIRRSKKIHMLPALCIAGVVTAIISVFFVTDFQISANDFSISIFLGIFEIGIGFILMVLGARFVPAAQVGLLALVEPLFAPICVWWGIGEVPSTFTIFGGLLIFLAILSNGVFRKKHS